MLVLWLSLAADIFDCLNKVGVCALQGMPTMSTTSARFDSQHKRAIDSMKKDKQKEVERVQEEAAATAALLETTTFKLEKAAARKNNLEREVHCLLLSHLHAWCGSIDLDAAETSVDNTFTQ